MSDAHSDPVMSAMDAGHWERLNDLFQSARALASAERDAFLVQACAEDTALRERVHQLLRADDHARAEITTAALVEALFEPMSAAADAAVGRRFGPYRVVAEIGRGGMGVVYLAERADKQYDKRVAIKLIKLGVDTETVLRLFAHERQILAALEHPNITRLLDAGTADDGRPYFVMEYVDGTPIREYCKAHALTIRQRLELFRRVCDAVAYAHRHLIVHRDIKPSNILVTADGEPKLLDFGIAKLMDTEGGGETISGGRLMTPEYASPEQTAGGAVTTLSDVYSLGIVLYELLAGCAPAPGAGEPSKPSGIGAGHRALRGDLDTIVLTALRTDPARRYQSVEQLSDDLARHVGGLPIVARADAPLYRLGKFIRRNAVVCGAAALVLLSLVGGIVATTAQARRARAEEAVARAEKARAERRFNDVRQLAHSVLFDYHDAIKNLPGATAVRERLVKDALVYLDSLTREASGDSGVQREVAAAYERVGDVRGEIYGASLGDMAGAIDSYQKSLRIREALVAADPRDVNNHRDLAYSYMKIGSQLQDTAEAARGLEYLRQACALYRQLSSKQPDNSEMSDYLSRAHNELGIALQQWGDAAGALEHHREALRLRQDLLAAQPRNDLHRRHLAITYWDMGQALFLRGDISAALQANQNAMGLSVKLLAENPTNIKDRRRVAISYQTDGEYRALAGDIAGALDCFRKKLQLDEQYLADDGMNAQARGDVGYSCERLGELLAAKGDHLTGLSYESRALSLYERLAIDSPQDLHIRHQTSVVASIVAELLAKVGKRREALDTCDKTIGFLNELPRDEVSTFYSDLRGQAYLHLGVAHAELARSTDLAPGKRMEHWRTARDLFQRSLDIWRDMQKRGVVSAVNATRGEQVAGEIAKCDMALAVKH